MSIHSNFLTDIATDVKNLFLPPVCPVCGGTLRDDEGTFCLLCRATVPQTNFWHHADNPVSHRLRDMIPIRHASSFIWFVQGSKWQEAIHSFKYRERWRTAYEMGRWFGSELSRSMFYATVDCVIPVPLHLRRKLKRGYNQCDYIAQGISDGLSSGAEALSHTIRRTRHNTTQTALDSQERWTNVHDLFAVRKPESLAGKHILLVDDVITTGSTLVSCADAILRSVPDCHISIATLAASSRHFGLDR